MARIRRALISVSDKSGIVDFCRARRDGRAYPSTGGTMRTLAEVGVPVTAVDEHTGFPR